MLCTYAIYFIRSSRVQIFRAKVLRCNGSYNFGLQKTGLPNYLLDKQSVALTYNLGTKYQFESSSSIKFKYAVYQCSYCTLTTHIYFQCYCSRVSLTFYYLRYYYIVALRYNFQEKEQLTSSRMAQSKMSSLLLLFSLLRPIHLYSIFEKSSWKNQV